MYTDRRESAALLARRLTSDRVRAVLLRLLPWCAPLVVFVGIRKLGDDDMLMVIQIAIVLAVGLVLSKRPGAAIVALCIGFPLAEFILPLLLANGAPLGLVKQLRYWKELMVFAVVIAAVRAAKVHRFKLDRLDKIGLGFATLVGVYWMFPDTFPPDGVPAPSDARGVAFRTIVLPIVAFIAVRHAHIDPKWRRRALWAAVAGGVLLAACAIFEILLPATWSSFLNEQLEVTRFRDLVQNDSLGTTISQTDYTLTGTFVQRAGTIFLDPLRSGFAFIAPLAVALDMARRRVRAAPMVAVGLIMVGLALTQTRSAILGGAVLVLGALRAGPGRSERSRAQLIFLIGLAAIAVLPIVASSALADRIEGAVNGSDQESTPYHQSRTEKNLDVVIENPLGLGLGRGGLASIRFGVTGNTIAENYFLGLAEDAGVFAVVLFAALLIAIILEVRRRFVTVGDSAAAAADMLLALAVGGMLLHSFDYIAVGAPAFVIAGLATAVRIPAADGSGAPRAQLAGRSLSR